MLKYLRMSKKNCTFAAQRYAKELTMVELKNIRWSDFEVVDAPKHELKPGQKVQCTYFRVNPGSYKPVHSNLTITDMPKELYDAFFQARV